MSIVELLKRKFVLENLGAQVLKCEVKSGRDGRDHVDLLDALRKHVKVAMMPIL